ncbi:MAG: biopolymer transporter ExbD [Cypionkella sp.]|nr:biopolymer transporter ExbD [Cypionkella sp.]
MKIADLQTKHRRRANFTPMIDVVFLLLIFFMMISRFGGSHALPLALAGQGGATWPGAPRLVTVEQDGPQLNGSPVALPDLAAALVALMTAPDDPIVLQPGADVPLQSLVDVIQSLRQSGLTRLVLVE